MRGFSSLGPRGIGISKVSSKEAPKHGEITASTLGQLSSLTFFDARSLQRFPKIVNAHVFYFMDGRTSRLGEPSKPKQIVALPLCLRKQLGCSLQTRTSD